MGLLPLGWVGTSGADSAPSGGAFVSVGTVSTEDHVANYDARVPPTSQPRRAEILEATARLLGREGPAGLTHRAVAAEADVPLAATTYYFASKDELLLEATKALVAEEVERLEAQRAALPGVLAPDTIAAVLAGVLEEQFDDRASLAKFEVYIAAARDEHLRPAARRWVGAFRALAEDVLGDASAAEAFVGAVDGLVLHELMGDGRVRAARLAPRIEQVLRGLAT